MRRLFIPILCVTAVVLCTADSPLMSEDLLKKLSAAGEQYVDEEIRQTILGVKQGAMQLAKETEQKLEVAEQQCQDSIKSSIRKCWPCLEDSCKAFYTSTCRRGFASFSFKVEEFFRKMATQLDATEHVYSQNQENSDKPPSAENQVPEDKINLELRQAEASFSQQLSNITLLYNQSIILAKRMQQVFGHSFLTSFTSGLQLSPLPAMQDGSSAGFFKTLGLDHVFHSAYDFGRDVLEEFSSMATDAFGEIHEAEEYFQQSDRDPGPLSAFGQPPSGYLCRQLRRQASDCLQFQDLCETCKDYLIKECPSVQKLHSEMDEMHMLLNASSQQYYQRLQLVQRHTGDTQRWLSSMQDQYGWVCQLSNTTAGPNNIFNVTTVNLQQQMKNNTPIGDRSVVVCILDSAPITILVPADLVVDGPAFLQYVAREALTLHKQLIRGRK